MVDPSSATIDARRMIAPHAAALRPSDIRLISQRILDHGLTPIRLDIGEPDGPTPEHIIEAASRAVTAVSRYAPAAGTPQFRSAAAAFLAQEHGVDVSAEDVVATAGATGGLATVFGLLCAPGDDVLVPVPGFPSYRTQVTLAGGRAVGYTLRSENGWAPDVADIEAAMTPATKAIVINTPGNPTGAIIDIDTMDELVALAEKHDCAIVSDEVYLDLALEGRAPSTLSRNRDRVFAVFSLSKSFSMTGWRIGFCVVPPGVAPSLTAVNAQLTASVNSVAQDAAYAALTGPTDHLELRRSLYRERRDAVHAYLTEHGIAHTVPAGTFYQLLALPSGTDSLAAALDLLDDGVAVVPSSAFGDQPHPFLRICLTAPVAQLQRGLDIIRSRHWV